MNSLMRRILFLPEQASTLAPRVDRLHYFVVTVTMLSSLLVGAIAVYFMFKYRERKPLASTPVVEPSGRFEFVVISIPLVFFLVWVVIGIRDFNWSQTPPKNAMDVYVTGKKWMWHFAYADGPSANANLHVPVGRPVRLLLTSRDVIHSFYVPEFRVKQDAVPGRYSELWFEATKPGRYNIFCTEFCGTWHSQMIGEVIAMDPAEFDRWYSHERDSERVARVDTSGPVDPEADVKGNLVNYGRRVAAVQGCFKCHSVDGQPHIGPTWVDLYLRKTTFADGSTAIADEGYLTESMMDPTKRLVKGYGPVMPSFRGKLTAPDAAALVEYIKSLRSERLQNVAAKEPVYGPVNQR
jgi:cytochrome c oxidase subunit 2